MRRAFISGLLMLMGDTAATASGERTAAPSALQGLARCKALSDAGQRLACYDQEAGTLLAAEQRSDIVVIGREQVERNRRASFGFSVPDVAVLRDRGGKVDILDQIEGVLASASQDGNGQWLFVLRDGSAWQQTDLNPQTWSPRGGDPVVVKRAGLGGYRISVAKTPGVRVRRVH